MQSCANLCACASKCAHVHFFAQDVQIIAKVHIEIFISIIRIQKESAEPIQSSKAKQLGIHLKQLAYSTTREKPLPPIKGKQLSKKIGGVCFILFMYMLINYVFELYQMYDSNALLSFVCSFGVFLAV